MAVRTKKLASGLVPSVVTGITNVYTCPVGETAIVKSLYVSASVSTSVTVSLNGSGGATLLLTKTVSPTVAIDLLGWFVLEPGDDIYISKSTSGVVHYWISGTELEGVAD